MISVVAVQVTCLKKNAREKISRQTVADRKTFVQTNDFVAISLSLPLTMPIIHLYYSLVAIFLLLSRVTVVIVIVVAAAAAAGEGS